MSNPSRPSRPSRVWRIRPNSIAAQTLALTAALTLLMTFGGVLAAYLQARRAAREQTGGRVLSVAEAVAVDPEVISGVQASDPSAALQSYAETVRRATFTDFVVIMSPDGIRYTHPDPRQIGGRYLGTITSAQQGKPLVEEFVGTLGPSRRAVVPVRDGDQIVALVAVGIRIYQVRADVAKQLPVIAMGALAGGLLGGAGALLIARRLNRATRGLDTVRLQTMADYHDAVLHSVTEGLLIIDPDARLRLANDEASRLLELASDAAGKQISELGLPDELAEALSDASEREDELHLTDQRVLVLNKARAHWRGRDLGAVVTIRDRTDLEHLTGELDQARSLAEALRSSAHEAGNRLHTMVSLIELGHPEQAVAFATEELAQAQRLTDLVIDGVDDPTLSALLLGKAAQAHERGITLTLGPRLDPTGDVLSPRDTVTIIGNLIDNAFEALAQAAVREVRLQTIREERTLRLVVADTGPGIDPAQHTRVLERGYSTHHDADRRRGLGLALVARTTQRLGGRISISDPPGAEFSVELPAPQRRLTAGPDPRAVVGD